MYSLSARKEVIVSAGIFQSPQLLMVSGIGPRATLSQYNIPVVADRPGVGQNMWVSRVWAYSTCYHSRSNIIKDHILFGPSYRVDAITGSSLAIPAFTTLAIANYNRDQTGILANTGVDFLSLSTFHCRSIFD